MAFQIHALPADLDTAGAMRVVATRRPGYPCRISLEDAEPGEEVLLLHYVHQPADTPFRASHAIYVRQGVKQAQPGPNEVPGMLRARVLSLRGFSSEHMLVDATLAEGDEIGTRIEAMLQNHDVAYVHLHFAKPGCYAARAERLVDGGQEPRTREDTSGHGLPPRTD